VIRPENVPLPSRLGRKRAPLLVGLQLTAQKKFAFEDNAFTFRLHQATAGFERAQHAQHAVEAPALR